MRSLTPISLAAAASVGRLANAATNRHDFLVTLERALKQQRADIKAAQKEEESPPPEEPKEEQAPELEVPQLRLAQAAD